jgi:type IV secretion system protein VirB10
MNDVDLVEASRVGYPMVAIAPSRKDGLGLAAGGAVALLLGAATFLGLSSGRDVQPKPAAPPVSDQAVSSGPAAPMPLAGDPAMLAGQPAEPAASLVFSPSQEPMQFASGPAQQQQLAAAAPSPLSQRLRSPTLLVDLSGPVVAAGAAPAAAAAERPAAAGGDEFAARADVSAGETAKATRLAQPAHTVIQGTLIPAVLETAINSDLPGYVRAVVSQDVRSFDGSRVLIPRSSRLIGQYRSGLAAGQTRTYVLWSRLIRPDGASVALASPATDEAGTTGLTGEVQSHFFKRFGSALLLSVVGAAGAMASGGASMLAAGGGASAASAATQQSGNIPPTVRVRQGQPIRVFTARDLDFSTVASAGRR